MKYLKKKLFLILLILLITSACQLPFGGSENLPEENTVEVPIDMSAIATSSAVPEMPTEVVPIVVPTETQVPIVATPTAIPTIEPTPINYIGCRNDAQYLYDVSISDGTLLGPGVQITKTWSIRNNGVCTWTSDYQWVQVDGDILQAVPAAKAIGRNVAPGETMEISVVLQLSAGAVDGERYQAQFQMQAPDGQTFGTHPYALVYASAGTAVCPVAFVGYLTYVSSSQGFCMFYPETYTVNTVFDDPNRLGVQFTSPHPVGEGEVMLTSLGINIEGSAGGKTSAEFANEIVNAWKIPGTSPEMFMVDLDGSEAYYTDVLPGMVGNRIIMTVHNDIAYIMTLMPKDFAFPEQSFFAEEFWDLLRYNLKWIEP